MTSNFSGENSDRKVPGTGESRDLAINQELTVFLVSPFWLFFDHHLCESLFGGVMGGTFLRPDERKAKGDHPLSGSMLRPMRVFLFFAQDESFAPLGCFF